MDHGYDEDILRKLASNLVVAKDFYDGDHSGMTDSKKRVQYYANLMNAIYDLTDYIEDGILPEED